MNKKTTIDDLEIAKFSQHATEWWDPEGPLKTLHDINATRLAFIFKHADVSGKKILDIGCGGGILCEGLSMAGASVFGLDAEPNAIAAARAHALKQGLLIQYDAEPVEQYCTDRSGVFDVITCMEMLEHVTSPAVVIQHAARLLKPDGLLFLSTINRTLKAYALAIVAAEYVLNILPRQTHDYEKFIKPSELAQMAREAGLEMLSMAGLDYHPFTRRASLVRDVDVNYLMVCRKTHLVTV
jgi:2-polyprenyl-6-hydroxyphenyl methylase/3-demethylubiquinone-9 3-methyltransferase